MSCTVVFCSMLHVMSGMNHTLLYVNITDFEKASLQKASKCQASMCSSYSGDGCASGVSSLS